MNCCDRGKTWKFLCPTMMCSLMALNLVFRWPESPAAAAESLIASNPRIDEIVVTVPEALSREKEWTQWIKDRREVVIQGRYSGRAGSNFRLKKLPFSFEAPRSSPLSDSLRAGVRMELTGVMRSEPGKIIFTVSKIVLGDLDIDLIKTRSAKIGRKDPEQLLKLAEEFAPVAAFYEDAGLKAEIELIRRTAFELKRESAQGNVALLTALIEEGKTLGVSEKVLNAIRFEALLLELRSSPNIKPERMEQFKKQCRGWDQVTPASTPGKYSMPTLVDSYNKADDAERTLIHRWLYRQIHLPELLSKVNPNGDNGIAIAAVIREQLPEETATAEQLERKEVDFRTTHVAELNRTELQRMAELLEQFKRTDELPTSLEKWLKAQETRFEKLGVSGLVRTADEYLFVGDRWNRTKDRDRGIDLLKEAWFAAEKQSPEAAQQIEDRLKTYGWERLKGQWMTRNQIDSLPDDDIQLAVRQGRVVRGMNREQVTGILGQPQRVARMIASKFIRELWIYETQGSSRMVIEFQRSKAGTGSDAKVLSVSAGN